MAKGYGHRKLYAYVGAKQRKLAPGMVPFVGKNKKELDDLGNRKLSGPGDMPKSAANGTKLAPKWSRVNNKGTNARKVSNYVDSNGGSRGRAKKILTQNHRYVSFGADPKSK